MTKPRFFKSQEDWRTWLERNHDKADELLVGFHKVATGKGGLTYQQALDEALCFGWIDAVRRGGDEHWTIRFTPRTARSIWSQVNIRRVGELTNLGRMHPSGLNVFQTRDLKREKQYSFENRDKAVFGPEDEKTFRANKKAWSWFEQAAPYYRRAVTWWVVSAKKPETRAKRLATLIECSARGSKVPAMTPPGERKAAARKAT
jgi:uncharacterized protein YdeI (YjbR/CyaY-like superfamily)